MIIGNQPLPGAAELNSFVRRAKSGEEIQIVAGEYKARVTSNDIAVDNGTIIVSEGPSETLVPFHAINSISIVRR